jgi:ribosomal protein L11 methyltransferase
MTVYKGETRASRADAELLADILPELLDPPPAISTLETPAGWLVELYFHELPDPDALEAVAEACPAAAFLRDLRLLALPEEDWVAVTQRGLHPVEAGRFFIHGSHDRDRAAGRSGAIEIEAGQAFGTAHHGTTRGCLLMIDRLAKKRRMARTLDVGTGSGILAIAAAKSLCRDVLATDIDPVAIRVAKENFALSGMAGRISGLAAAGLRHPDIVRHAPFDLVIANILAGPLIGLAPEIYRVVAPGGHLVLSGLLDEQAREVSGRYLAQGFVMDARMSLEGWMTLCLRQSNRQARKKPPRVNRAAF